MTRLLFSGVLSIAALAGIGGAASSQAAEPQLPGFRIEIGHGHDHRHFRRYAVYYRTCNHEPWRYYGSYSAHWEAHRAENYLERRGYSARVEHRDQRRHRGPWDR